MIDPSPLQPDDPVQVGPYRLLGCLGAGGQGIVYLGESPAGQRVAVKVLHLRLSRDPRARRRFLGEVAAALRVRQFCTARVVDVNADDTQPYIVSEYVQGPSLAQLVQDEGPRDPDALERLAASTITALAAIHKVGIIHRDFKPSNVICGPDGPRVIDFGIARLLDMTATTSSFPVGTPAYMSPEQVSAGRVGPASDVFSWAGTMLYAASGLPPFGRDSIPATFHRILNTEPDLTGATEPLRSMIAECLAKDPDQRPTATDLWHTFLGHESAADDPVPAESPPPAVDLVSCPPTETISVDHPYAKLKWGTSMVEPDVLRAPRKDHFGEPAPADGDTSPSSPIHMVPPAPKRPSLIRRRPAIIVAAVALGVVVAAGPLWRWRAIGNGQKPDAPNVTGANRDIACRQLQAAGYFCEDHHELAPNYQLVNRQDQHGRLAGIYWSPWRPVNYYTVNTDKDVWTLTQHPSGLPSGKTETIGTAYPPRTKIPNAVTIDEFVCETTCYGVARNRYYARKSDAMPGWVDKGPVVTLMTCGIRGSHAIYRLWKDVSGGVREFSVSDDSEDWGPQDRKLLGCVW